MLRCNFYDKSAHFDSFGCHFFGLSVPFLFAQEQVTACCLDTRNVPGLLGIPPNEHDKAWVIVEESCVKVIDEVKGAEDAHTHYHTDDCTSDFMLTAAVALTTLFT